jgi:hypothetical protein
MRDIGGDWYSYEIQGAASASMVFTDGEGNQTKDLFRDEEGWYTLPDGWSAKNPDAVVPPPLEIKPKSRGDYYSTAK